MRNSSEGEITIQEGKTAIAISKKGKVPGSDGIILEFYIAFFKLVDAFNDAYKKG